eukprot:14688297-Ditylum_brightwellii.AAC.1
MGRFYQCYCDEEAQDTMTDYLYAFQHPTKENHWYHSDHTETLVQYSKKLPGLTPVVDATQTKKIIFGHYLEKWRTLYICDGEKLSMDALTNFTQFMPNEKLFADTEDDRFNCKCPERGKNNKNEDGKKGIFQSNNYSKNNKDWDLDQGVPDSDPCPKHGPHHTSGQC